MLGRHGLPLSVCGHAPLARWLPTVPLAVLGSASPWPRYRERHRQVRVPVPGFPNGRVGRVTLVRQNGRLKLRWYEDRRGQWEAVHVSDGAEPLAAAVARAAEISERLVHRAGGGSGWRRVTVRQAAEAYLRWKEVSGVRGSSLRAYRVQLDRVLAFAEGAPEGRRCRTLDRVDAAWCETFVGWLGAVTTTASGGPVSETNPARQLSQGQQFETKGRLRGMLLYAAQCSPALVPRFWSCPITGQLVGRRPRPAERGPSSPPVAVADLVVVVGQLDEYGLALLSPLFLYGPRPSELGRILLADLDPERGVIQIQGRPACGYQTKAATSKFLPVTGALAACLRPLLARCRGGPIFVRRSVFGDPARGPDFASEAALAAEFAGRRLELAGRLGRQPAAVEVERLARETWVAAGAVAVRDVSRELERAARRAGLARVPTARGIRHLVESLCEEARLSPGVIRHLLGHRPGRGDALYHYSHTSIEMLARQVAALDALRASLISALAARAAELVSGPAGRKPGA